MDMGLVKIACLPGFRFRGNHIERHGIVPQGGVIQRILPVGTAQRAIDIVQIHIGFSFHKIAQTHVLLSESVFGIELIIAASLPGPIGSQIRAARRNADAQIEVNPLIHAVVQYTGGVNSPQSAAYIHNAGFHTHLTDTAHFLFSRNRLF